MDINEIMRCLPHRYPFVLVDRVLEIEPGKRVVAVKNVSINEPYFQGHFPGHPVMPGVLILEALAQAAGVLSYCSLPQKPDASSLYLLVGVDDARFKKPVVPGDQLILEAEITRQVRGIWKYAARARVDGQIVAEAVLMCAVREA